jgi:hypothetical protein
VACRSLVIRYRHCTSRHDATSNQIRLCEGLGGLLIVEAHLFDDRVADWVRLPRLTDISIVVLPLSSTETASLFPVTDRGSGGLGR